MFWGVTLETGKRYSQRVEESYHLTMAALEPPTTDGKKTSKYVSVMVEHEKTEYMICTLEPNRNLQVNLDHMFVEGEEVTYFLNGDGTVHLTGYLVGDPYDDFDEEGEDEEESEAESEDNELHVKANKRKNEALDSSPEKAIGKKAKVDNKVNKDVPKKDSKAEEKDSKFSAKKSKELNHKNDIKVQKLNAINNSKDDMDSDEDSDEEEDEESDDDMDDSLGLIDKEAVEVDSEDDEEESDEDDEESDESEEKPKQQQKPQNVNQRQQQNQNKQNQSKPQNDSMSPQKSPQNQQNNQKKPWSGQKGGFQGNQRGNQQQKGNWNQKGGQNGPNRQSGGNQWQNKKQFGGGQQNNSPNFRGGQQNTSPNFKGGQNNSSFKGGKQTPGFKGDQQKGGSFNNTPKFGQKEQKSETKQKKVIAGVVIEDLVEGKGGNANRGQFVHVSYVGRLPNNKVFDRTYNKPFSFRLGRGEVIKGWDVGLEGMKVGGKRKITVPSNMGYGNRSVGPIPANSTLEFEVELKSIT